MDNKGFLSGPFANEKPLFVITAATAEKYKDKLSAGQLAMLKRYPDRLFGFVQANRHGTDCFNRIGQKRTFR